MDLNFSAFQEPRGVMRVLHLFFSIAAFASLTDYTGTVKVTIPSNATINSIYIYKFSYPFDMHPSVNGSLFNPPANKSCSFAINADFSSDAKFFVATGVLAMLCALALIVIYMKFDSLYKSNDKVQLADFLLTVIFAVLWLSSSAAWANGLTHLKDVTDPNASSCKCTPQCHIATSSYSTLNVSVVLGFLNFFLWASDLWFVYKETSWFRNSRGVSNSGV